MARYFLFSKFAGNIAVRPLISETVRLPIKGKPTTSLLSASCLLTFSDTSEPHVFCTTQLLKVNSIQKLFIILFAVSRSPFTQTVTLAYYTVCEAKKNVNLKINKKKTRVNLAIKFFTALKWVCVNAVNNTLN